MKKASFWLQENRNHLILLVLVGIDRYVQVDGLLDEIFSLRADRAAIPNPNLFGDMIAVPFPVQAVFIRASPGKLPACLVAGIECVPVFLNG